MQARDLRAPIAPRLAPRFRFRTSLSFKGLDVTSSSCGGVAGVTRSGLVSLLNAATVVLLLLVLLVLLLVVLLLLVLLLLHATPLATPALLCGLSD